jgi:hypothetical protein
LKIHIGLTKQQAYGISILILFGKAMLKKVLHCLFIVYFLIGLSGCVAVSVVSTAVGVTATVVGGAIDVVDAVTPDILDDDEQEDEADDNDGDEPEGAEKNQ